MTDYKDHVLLETSRSADETAKTGLGPTSNMIFIATNDILSRYLAEEVVPDLHAISEPGTADF